MARPVAALLLVPGIVLSLASCALPIALPSPTAAPEETTAPPAGDVEFVEVSDDLDVVALNIPSTWTDVSGEPFTDANGQQWGSVVAAPDIRGFVDTFDVSGIEIAAAPADPEVADATLAEFLTSLTDYLRENCDVLEELGTYDDGSYVGVRSAFENCGGVDTEALALVVVDNDRRHIVYVLAHTAGADDPQVVFPEIVRTFRSTI